MNRTNEPIDLSGYKLSDADEVRHVFAAGTVLPPFEATVVFGGGKPAGEFGNAAENRLVFTASTGGFSLNNGGDTIKLEDAQGRILQEIKFDGAQGGANQSINRNPDAGGAEFSLHTIVAEDSKTIIFTRRESFGRNVHDQACDSRACAREHPRRRPGVYAHGFGRQLFAGRDSVVRPDAACDHFSLGHKA